jgi:hypothetical protein
MEGFNNHILPCIVGSVDNIELIPWIDNYKKHVKCSITKNNLCESYYKEG